MTWHTMVLTEPHPTKAGFISRYFAIVDVAMSGTNWFWQQVDDDGKHVGNASAAFAKEDAALDDALATLDGHEWE
jgi:hypothetical protein